MQVTIDQAIELALQHHRAGRFADAEAIYRQILAVDPLNSNALHLLGTLAGMAGQPRVAVDLIARAIEINPARPEYHSNFGEFQRQLGNLDQATASIRRAIELAPNYPGAWNNLGIALDNSERFDESIAAYEKAIALEPGRSEFHNNLGAALGKIGRSDQAIAACRQAIALEPNYAIAYVNLGNSLKDLGRIDEATAAYRDAIKINPNFVDPHNNLGDLLLDNGHVDEAIAEFHTAIELNPNSAESFSNLGNCHKEQGRIEQAVQCFRKAIAIKPDDAKLGSNLVYSLSFHPDYDGAQILAESRAWTARHARPLANQILPFQNQRVAGKRLRIGYVSPDFRAHAVAGFLLPLLANHDPRNVEVFCYSDVRRPDEFTARMQNLAHHWQDAVGMCAAALASQVRSDGIDILVDLALHSAHNRLLVFARKPAPVQVTWLGYPGGTGLDTIDYRLSDRYLDPPGQSDRDYVETTVRLPHCYWCYEPPGEAPAVNALPALSEGLVTFGCFNRFAKVSQAALELWIQLLKKIPDSRLLLASHPGAHIESVRQRFADAGLAPARLEFLGRTSFEQYLRNHNRLDIALDPFPCAGGTTSCDALWMGVPIITLSGNTAAGRSGVTLLSNIGLTEFIASTPQEYLAIAARTAADLPKLASLRTGLRERMRHSPFMDPRQFASDMEAAYRKMWATWCLQTSS